MCIAVAGVPQVPPTVPHVNHTGKASPPPPPPPTVGAKKNLSGCPGSSTAPRLWIQAREGGGGRFFSSLHRAQWRLLKGDEDGPRAQTCVYLCVLCSMGTGAVLRAKKQARNLTLGCEGPVATCPAPAPVAKGGYGMQAGGSKPGQIVRSDCAEYLLNL